LPDLAVSKKKYFFISHFALNRTHQFEMDDLFESLITFSQTDSFLSLSQTQQESMSEIYRTVCIQSQVLHSSEPEKAIPKKQTRKGSKNISYSLIDTFDTKKEAIDRLETMGVYVRDFGNEKHTKFKCEEHHLCKHFGKVSCTDEGFKLEVGGTHSDLLKVRVHGIDPRIKPELDLMLEGNMTAGKALNKLQVKYRTTEMLHHLPSSQQVVNRKAYLCCVALE
jgi:hypothetical protein